MASKDNQQSVTDPQDLARLLVSRANSGDVEGMAALYESDAVIARSNQTILLGRDAIRKFYAELISTRIKFHLGEQRSAIICGDLALTSTLLPNGHVTAEVARRQSDGSWRWAIDQPQIALVKGSEEREARSEE
jgi:ketosteroid isomerase-like protein